MSSSHRLSLAAAVLINVNIMVGSGIFINTIILARMAGGYSALTYLLVSILILPLMLGFAQLAQIHKGGSLYVYSATLSPYAGFFSAWGYFFTKLASCAVAIHVAATLFTSIIPPLATLPLLITDIILLILFTVLNCYHVNVGKRVQAIFMFGKLIPIATVIFGGLLYFNRATFHATPIHALGIISGIPLVLYAFMGFEATAGFMRRLAHPERDGWRVIALSFVLGVTATTFFQLCLFGNIPELNMLGSYQDLFPALLAQWHLPQYLRNMALCLLHGGIAASAAGVAFSILYANAGNIYELAANNLIPRRWYDLTQENAHQAPLRCILIEAAVVCGYLIASHTNLPALQQLAAFGATCTFGVSMAALSYQHYYNRALHYRILPLTGLVSCALLFAACIRNFAIGGLAPLFFFIFIQLAGACIYHSSRNDA